jgi:hypothetical protein
MATVLIVTLVAPAATARGDDISWAIARRDPRRGDGWT